MSENYIQLQSGRKIGTGNPCFIVAEIGNNHQGDFELARKMIATAARAGVDAVKFQKRNIRAMMTKDLMNSPYTGANSFGPTYGEHRKALELSIDEFARLKEIAENEGLIFFASVWDEVSLKEIKSIGVEIIKIPSADLVNVPLLRKAAAFNIPIFLSTGMSTWEEIDRAVKEIKSYHTQLVLLHCNSSYPCPNEEISLPLMRLLKQRYRLPVGYSGHEKGIAASLAAVALGACVVERHFTFDKALPGTDHQVSLTPDKLKELVKGIREIEKAMQRKEKKVFPAEKESAKKLRKSIVAAREIKAGSVLSEQDIAVKSPGVGLSPLFWDNVIGQRVKVDLKEDDLLLPEYLEGTVQ
jgi:sialic acid synthase SpsE